MILRSIDLNNNLLFRNEFISINGLLLICLKIFDLEVYSIYLQVFFCVMIGAFAMGNAGPNFQYFSTARGAAHKVYSIIDQVLSYYLIL